MGPFYVLEARSAFTSEGMVFRHRLLHDSGMDSIRHRVQRSLRAALLANAAFSGLSAVALLLFSSEVTTFAGLSAAFHPTILACSLLLFGSWLLTTALRREVRLSDARIAVALDAAWVAVSIPIILFCRLTNGGRLLLIAVGTVVSLFAFLQWRGIRIIRASAIEASHA
jgi:hypothetical protein